MAAAAAAATFPGSLSAMQPQSENLHSNEVSDEPTSTQGDWAGPLRNRLLKTSLGLVHSGLALSLTCEVTGVCVGVVPLSNTLSKPMRRCAVSRTKSA